MGKEALWSMSTTIREAERIIGFLKSAIELNGKEWNKSNQELFQILLIKNRQYLDPNNSLSLNKLSSKQIAILKDIEHKISLEEATDIFTTKNYEDPPMRGRQSMSPLKKLGLVNIINNKISITDVGHKLASGEISFDEFMLDALLKFQYPNPEEEGFKNWNTKPFIAALHLIKEVNNLCSARGIKEKGISSTEFGIFALSLRKCTDIKSTAKKLLDFRVELESVEEKQRSAFISKYIEDYLYDFNNPVKNTSEYTDNMIRYLRLTKYIYIRGKYLHTYIDLEPRRLKEIDEILIHDDGSAKTFSLTEWQNYMGTFGTYSLPFETVPILTQIATDVIDEINELSDRVGKPLKKITVPTEKTKLKELIFELRTERTELQNLQIKQDYRKDTSKIDEVISALTDIKKRNKAKLAKRFSIELERWANIALNIINDALEIKPNAPVGDDNVPTYTAPSGVADIECFYQSFNAICEVTMLTSRDQWYNEGQPVMRHLREFEEKYNAESYCLFIAPTLHEDTLETFWMAVQHGYKGEKQKIVPITIEQLISILKTVRKLLDSAKEFTHKMLVEFFDMSLDIDEVQNSTKWSEFIWSKLDVWNNNLVI